MAIHFEAQKVIISQEFRQNVRHTDHEISNPDGTGRQTADFEFKMNFKKSGGGLLVNVTHGKSKHKERLDR